MNQGISSLHGMHHVAQKSRRTTFPRRSESFSGLPVGSLRAKSGAGFRSFSGLSEAARARGVRRRPAQRKKVANRASTDSLYREWSVSERVLKPFHTPAPESIAKGKLLM